MSGVPINGRGLDFDLTKVGRACVTAKALPLVDQIHHMLCVRRKRGMGAVYQVDQTEVATPTRGVAANSQYRWRYLTGYNTHYVRVTVLTLGGVISSSADPSLTCTTSTESATTFARVSDEAAPTSTINPATLAPWSVVKEVTPNSVEDIEIDQTSTSDLVRILTIVVEELPTYTIASGENGFIDPNDYAPGTDIIDTEYDDLVIGQQTMRRFHKKVLWSNSKVMTTTRTAARDLITDSAAALLEYDIFPSVNLPERSGVDVTGYVLAANTVATNGNVTLAFGAGGSVAITNITTGIAWYTATGTCAELADTLSYQGWNTAAGTLTVYQAILVEQTEAT